MLPNDNAGTGEAAGKADTFEPALVEGLEGVVIKSVSAGHAHAMALSEDGQVFSWGAGCLGLPDKAPRRAAQHVKGLEGHRVKMLSSGGQHAGALTEEGLLLTWGNGENGRLGHGDNTHHLEPCAILDIDPFDKFECGDHFCAAISRGDGLLYTWGHNKVGELGHEGMSVFAQESSPLPIDKDEYFGGEKIVNVGCGHQHSVAVTEGGAVYIWGSAGFVHHMPHRFNMLSPPAWPSGSVIEKAYCGQSYSIVVTSGHSALAWGRNQWGVTASISMGEYVGTTGVLGLGDKTRGWGEVEPREVSAIRNVSSVSAGPLHAAYIAEAA